MREPSRYERQLSQQIGLSNLPPPELEHYFAKELRNERGHRRMFRFDFAWPVQRVAAEVDGGRYLVRRGKDGRPVPVGQHMGENDYEKLNCAVVLGWRVFRFTPEHIRSGKAVRWLEEVLMR